MKGIVLKSTGSWYDVLGEDDKTVRCRIKGRFRLDDIRHTNPVTVGDHVDFTLEEGLETGIIGNIAPRTNYIIRKASNLSRQTHIIASNMDQAMLIATLVHPTTSLGFIDRFLVTAEAYHIPAIIVFNKVDLCGGALAPILDETVKLYTQRVGYRCVRTSTVSGEGIEEMKQLLKGRTTLVSGHSGVGKSSLVNCIEPGLELKTREVSAYHKKGQHTTTFAEMHPLHPGFIIDTPGIREFGVIDIEPTELSHYFRDMRPYIGSCRFNNCRHVNEPGCAVLTAVAEGKIAEERYHSYRSILANEDIYA